MAIGSAKSNIGHLKAAAGAAGFLKAVMAIHHKELPPSLHVEELNPNIDWAASPFAVNTELRPWDPPTDGVRTAGVSAFGFGGTNFHAVLEEYVPGHVPTDGQKVVAVGAELSTSEAGAGHGRIDGRTRVGAAAAAPKAPLRGALVLGADDEAALAARLRGGARRGGGGTAPAPAAPREADLRAAERVAIDYADADDLADKVEQALAAFAAAGPLEGAARARHLPRQRPGAEGRLPLHRPGLAVRQHAGGRSATSSRSSPRRSTRPTPSMTPLLGRPLTSYLFVDASDPDAVAAAEADLRRTEITQPAVLSVDLALTRLLAAYGIVPDLVMGHSLGEYGALVAAGALSFPAALEAVSARGPRDGPPDDGGQRGDGGRLRTAGRDRADRRRDRRLRRHRQRQLHGQAVIGGATAAVNAAVEKLPAARLPDRHAPGEPRLPHVDRGSGQRTAAAARWSASSCGRPRSRSWRT